MSVSRITEPLERRQLLSTLAIGSVSPDITLSSTKILDHSSVGTVVGRLHAFESGTGNTFLYTLVSGTGATNNGSFAIDGNNDLYSNQEFNYATKNSYSIRVCATDQLNHSFEKVFVISVLHATRTLTVDVLGDTAVAGHATLRQAIVTANSDAAGDTISFANSLTGTIVLTQGELSITNSITISGPGAAVLSVSGNNLSRIFNIDDQDSTVTERVTITGLTLTRGNGAGVTNSGMGGALFNAEKLTLSSDTISGSTADLGGGIDNLGSLTSGNDTFSSNVARVWGGGVFDNGAWISTNDSVVGNSAQQAGGGIFNLNGLAVTTNDTIVSNIVVAAGPLGFGAGVVNGGAWDSLNTIVAGNHAATIPSDVVLTNSGTVFARNTLIGNAATAGGVKNGVNGNIVGVATGALFATDVSGNIVLTDNGGPTQTIGLKPSSPAIGVGGGLATLSASLAATSTTLTVNASTFVAVGDLLRIDSEILLVTAVSGTNVSVQRGQNSSTAVTHALNSVITLAYDQRGSVRFNTDVGSFATSPDIELSNSKIVEHLPVGTVVGTFSTLESGTGNKFTYLLVAGSGGTNNANFSIDSSGSLKSTQALDFVSQNSDSVRIRETDQFNRSFEKVFVISVLHAPRTLTVDVLGDAAVAGHITLRQAIMTANTDGASDTITFASNLTGMIKLTQGELEITNGMTITGPGAGVLSVSGNNLSRIFHVDDGNSKVTEQVTITGLTLTQGNTANVTGVMNSGLGGALFNAEKLTLSNDALSGNRAALGGAIDNSGSLISGNNTFSSNIAGSWGGGILNNGTMTSTNDTFAANSAHQAGGGIFSFSGLLITANDTIVSNIVVAAGPLGYGGGVAAGGLWNLVNTIVAGNHTATTPSDVSLTNAGTLFAHNSLIGDAATAGGIKSGVNGNIVSLATGAIFLNDTSGNPLLANNGGPTQTIALKVNGPAIGAGGTLSTLSASLAATANTLIVNDGTFVAVGDLLRIDDEVVRVSAVSGTNVMVQRGQAGGGVASNHAINASIMLAFDQRGSVRVNNDLGGFATPPDIKLSNTRVMQSSPVGTVVATFMTRELGTGNTFTYSLVTGVGSTDNASFSIDAFGTLMTTQVFTSVVKNSYSIRVREIDQFDRSSEGAFAISVLHVPPTLTVDVLGDAHVTGRTTLREAITQANQDAAGDIVNFASGLTGMIILTQGVLRIDTSMSIEGPGATVITISGNNDFRLFTIADENNDGTNRVTITGLTLTGGLVSGDTNFGGAIANEEILTLANDAISNNSAVEGGGGILNFGFLTSSNDTFSGNSAVGGGAIYNLNTMMSTNDTFTGNTAFNDGGGAIDNLVGSLITVNDTIAGNHVYPDDVYNDVGGGIRNEGIWKSVNTIVADNYASTSGGWNFQDEVYNSTDSTVSIRNTLIADEKHPIANPIFFTVNDFDPVVSYNGGSTQTIALTSNSPAIGASEVLALLSAPAIAVATTLAVNDGTFVAIGDSLRIDSEILLVTAVSGTTVGVLRGQDGSTAATHAPNSAITLAYDQRGRVRFNNDIGSFATSPDIERPIAKIIEHRPVGTLVETLSTSEFGAGNSFTYRLAAGAGGDDNSSFSLDASGNLTTNQVFDFETKNSYSIRVRETDQLNRSFEQVIVVLVLHVPRSLIVDVLNDIHQYQHTTLREAVFTAESDGAGDTITFATGLSGMITLTQGELLINCPMTIMGPGAGILSISGNNASRIFNIDDGDPTVTEKVTITGLRLTQGNAINPKSGGAVFNAEQLTISSSLLVGNTGNTGGGIENTGALSSTNNTFASNTAWQGGGIQNDGALASSNDVFIGNSVDGLGGAICNGSSAYRVGSSASSALVISTNDTIYGNSAVAAGGGLSILSGSCITSNDTIVGNNGGGVYIQSGGVWVAVNTIVAGNGSFALPSDVTNSSAAVSARNTLIGDAASAGGIKNGVNGDITGASAGTVFVTDSNGNPLLANNGGPTQTIALKSGGPAINAGGALATLSASLTATATTLNVNDRTFIAVGDSLRIDSEILLVTTVSGTTVTVQRGQSNSAAAPHALNAAIVLAVDQRGSIRFNNDVGSFATSPDVELSNAKIVEHSPAGTMVGTFTTLESGTGNSFSYLLVSGTGGSDNASFSIDSNGNLKTKQVFDFATKNSNSIRIRETDQYNRSLEIVFVISVLHAPRTLTVNVSGDAAVEGRTTLRQAIATADGDGAGDTITFASTLTGTIILSQGELPITNGMTITGPGSGILSVSGNNLSRIFKIDDGNSKVTQLVTITGLTMTQGKTSLDGGALFNAERLILTNDRLSGNSAISGGAISNTGLLSSSNDTFSTNTALLFGGGVSNTGSMTSSHDTFSTNVASFADGGAIWNSALMVSGDDTYSGNSARGFGGGIDSYGAAYLSSTNDTFFGNSASSAGGGIANANGRLITTNDTIAGNSAGNSTANDGGGVYNSGGGVWNALNTIVAGNKASSVASDVYNVTSTFTARNTLIGDAATAGGIANGMNGNIVSVATSAIFATDPSGNLVLANNGGTNLTIALFRQGSRAVAAGGLLATLSASLTATATTAIVNDGTFIAVGDLLKIDAEIVRVTAVSGTNVSFQRGQSGTTAAVHATITAFNLAYDETGATRVSNDLGAVATIIIT